MKENSEYRAEARQALKDNWNTSALFVFVYFLLASVISSAFSASFSFNDHLAISAKLLGTFLVLPLEYGAYVAFLRFFRGEEIEIGWLFDGYRQQRVWTTSILKYVYTILWSLLLIIPGIIKSYSYAMTDYILRDNPELKDNAAIELSMQMMQGYKMKLFLLHLSFLGWIFLSILTLGIGLFWVIPYMYSAQTAFYEDLKQNN